MTRFTQTLVAALGATLSLASSTFAAAPASVIPAAPLSANAVEITVGPITVAPAKLELTHIRRPQSLQILGTTADGFTVDLHAKAKYSSADEKIATVDAAGWVRPITNGTTKITITVPGQPQPIPNSPSRNTASVTK